MPHRTARPVRALAARTLLVLVLVSALAGCRSGAAARGEPAGHRTTVETLLPGDDLVVEVVEAAGAAHARSWRGATTLLEEIRTGTDHWVRLPALEREGILRPGWIHLDLADPDQRAWLATNALGLLEHRDLWSARPGDAHGDDVVAAVDHRSPTRRLLRLASGLELRVTREALATAPVIGAPTAPAIVPLAEVRRLLAG